MYNRQLIKGIHSVMVSMNKESFSFDVKDENCPCVTNQNNNFKYKIDTIYIPNIGREKYFIELDVYNSYDNQYYNIIIDEDEWDGTILESIFNKIVNGNSETCYSLVRNSYYLPICFYGIYFNLIVYLPLSWPVVAGSDWLCYPCRYYFVKCFTNF